MDSPLSAPTPASPFSLRDGEAAETSLAARRLRHLSQIGLALSAEHDIKKLLASILTTSRDLTTSDGGSLYIVEKDANGDKQLYFRAAQNDSIVVDTAMSFPVSATSLAGYAALSGEILSFEDVYDLPADAPYKFNPVFDHEHGYRTKSVLVVPMQNHNGDVIGVLQLINRKRQRETLLRDAETTFREVIPFDAETGELAATLASQAAVALNNYLLIREIESLFEALVIAASGAIEDRDPTTSGHSKRVTTLTLELAKAISQTREGPLADIHFTPAQLRELRYAGLLHDFGKIGVRERVLMKSRKVEPDDFANIKSRMLALRSQWERDFATQKLQVHESQLSPEEKRDALARLANEAQQKLALLEADAAWLEKLNSYEWENATSEEWQGADEALKRLSNMTICDWNGTAHPLLYQPEVEALQIRRGTLTRSEFEQIQAHAQMSYEFLRQIPWTANLENVPQIAQAHHERLDGSGYPLGLKGDEIPFGSKLMGIADMFDALTASDRPYKSAMPLEKALAILKSQAEMGKLDPDALNIFIEREIWKKLEKTEGSSST